MADSEGVCEVSHRGRSVFREVFHDAEPALFERDTKLRIDSSGVLVDLLGQSTQAPTDRGGSVGSRVIHRFASFGLLIRRHLHILSETLPTAGSRSLRW